MESRKRKASSRSPEQRSSKRREVEKGTRAQPDGKSVTASRSTSPVDKDAGAAGGEAMDVDSDMNSPRVRPTRPVISRKKASASAVEKPSSPILQTVESSVPQPPRQPIPQSSAAKGTAKTPAKVPDSTKARVDSHQQPLRTTQQTRASSSKSLSVASARTSTTHDTPTTGRGRSRAPSRLSHTTLAGQSADEDADEDDDEQVNPGIQSKLKPDDPRRKARVGKKDDSLAHIMCTNIETGEKKELHWKHINKMDWDDPGKIEALNSWSAQIHRRSGEKQKSVVKWHRDEETWVELYVFKTVAKTVEDPEEIALPIRDVLAHAFNKFFKGRILQDRLGNYLEPCEERIGSSVGAKLDRLHKPLQRRMKAMLTIREADTYLPKISMSMLERFVVAKKALVAELRRIDKSVKAKELDVDLKLIGGQDKKLKLWGDFLEKIRNLEPTAEEANEDAVGDSAPAIDDADYIDEDNGGYEPASDEEAMDEGVDATRAQNVMDASPEQLRDIIRDTIQPELDALKVPAESEVDAHQAKIMGASEKDLRKMILDKVMDASLEELRDIAAAFTDA